MDDVASALSIPTLTSTSDACISGIGFGIARVRATPCGGELTLHSRKKGGLVAEIRLPASAVFTRKNYTVPLENRRFSSVEPCRTSSAHRQVNPATHSTTCKKFLNKRA
ncbi:HAMP domain-containing histidine kinase [Novosphingobium sp. P6W]|uniref:HAMP domain-containing histidine kinase n=1 Tax=Novosphingobium sp. P6W TaxID=1609758 RepID=UPI000A4EF735|nr:HAMP domain-containing histidine kinase [Novosphingobium sp. P6W]